MRLLKKLKYRSLLRLRAEWKNYRYLCRRLQAETERLHAEREELAAIKVKISKELQAAQKLAFQAQMNLDRMEDKVRTVITAAAQLQTFDHAADRIVHDVFKMRERGAASTLQ